MKIIRQNCDPSLADDRSLPYTAYIVTYQSDEDRYSYDIVICNKQTEIFDYYWDRYREGLIGFKQTEGRVNPKLWQDPAEKKKRK